MGASVSNLIYAPDNNSTNSGAQTGADKVSNIGRLQTGASDSSPDTYMVLANSGAVTIPLSNKTYFITKSTVAALTIAAPTATVHDGVTLSFITTTAQAHTLTLTSGNYNGGATTIATWAATKGNNFSIEAYQGTWYVWFNTNVTLS